MTSSALRGGRFTLWLGYEVIFMGAPMHLGIRYTAPVKKLTGS
ncbi:hypothetical protein C4K39_2102 [Pseudomonas sessilinigenes]|nr:hypothetical protein C4K39_2102 [Pseudomonas sessilinigenes]